MLISHPERLVRFTMWIDKRKTRKRGKVPTLSCYREYDYVSELEIEWSVRIY